MSRLAHRFLGTVSRVKRVVAAAVGVLLLVVALAAIRQAAGAVLKTSEGADARTAFHRALTAPVEIRSQISWLPDRVGDGRRMEPKTRDDITDAYAQAWSSLDRASQGDPEAPVGEYLAGAALEHVRRQLTSDAIRSTSVRTVHVSHQLQLTFYSDDGSVVALDAPRVVVERVVSEDTDPQRKPHATVVGTTSTTTTTTVPGVAMLDDGIHETVARTTESYRLVMMLRDGNWRVELIERMSVGALEAAHAWSVPTTVLTVPKRVTTTTSPTLRGMTTTTTTKPDSARREWRR